MSVEKDESQFSEYLKSTSDLILERFSSPFIFSFVVSWLISNYKIVMVILTDQTNFFSLEHKVDLVSQYTNLSNSFLYPAFAALFYTFAYPYLDQQISKFTLKRKIAKRNDRFEVERVHVRTVEEVEAIHRLHFETEKTSKKEIDDLKIIQEQLKVTIKDLENKNQESENVVQVLKAQVAGLDNAAEGQEKSGNVSKAESGYLGGESSGSAEGEHISVVDLNKKQLKLIDEIGNSFDQGPGSINESALQKITKLKKN